MNLASLMMEKIIGNKGYKPVYQEAEDIYTFHEQKLLSTLVWSCSTLHNIYFYSTWLQNNINVHIKFALLQGVSKCCNKQLVRELSLALMCTKHHFKNYSKVIEKIMGNSYDWSVDNSFELINKISDIKFCTKYQSIWLFHSLHRFTIECYLW